MKLYKVTNIVWEKGKAFPNTAQVEVPDGLTRSQIENHIADTLANRYGCDTVSFGYFTN